MPCSTPVIFLIFRRPNLTARVFEAIRQAQPAKLLVVADGPRYKADVELCQQARAIVEQVDWECEVLRNYSEANLGCRKRVSSGLDWAFRHVEQAIILEDDCLPHPSFFYYCEALLDRYREDRRVMVISGNNFQDGQQRTNDSYYFSKYNHCWGWATWRSAWEHWEFDAQRWIDFRNAGLMHSVCNDPCEAKYWTDAFDKLFFEKTLDIWDYAWTFACWSQSGLTVLPSVNLVSNIGFGSEATHTFGNSIYSNMPTHEIIPINHPLFVVRHQEADDYTFNHHFGGLQIRRERFAHVKVKRKLIKIKESLKSIFS